MAREKQQKDHYQTMKELILKEMIVFLNDMGGMSALYLMRKYKWTYEEALIQLKKIVDNYGNVKFIKENVIYIAGREPDWLIVKPKKKRIRPKKPPRWKDVTKP